MKDYEVDNFRAKLAKLKAERDAAFVRGLERGKEICGHVVDAFKKGKLPIEKWTAHEAANRIQAEIDKAGK